MGKYFEQNMYEGESLVKLHSAMSGVSSIVQNNLFFHEVYDDGDTETHRKKLAMSAYSVIAVCEAIIDRVPEDERAKAHERVREMVAPIDTDEILKKLLKRLFD